MISIHIMGGLGNQLFQIFTTIAYAIKYNHNFIFPFYEKYLDRYTYWNNFLINLKKFTTANLIHNISNNDISSYTTINEEFFHYKELPIHENNENIKLNGYFQSYKYFQNEIDQIYNLIELDFQKKILIKQYDYLFNNIDDGNIISMHFRLGDYKQLQHLHPIMSIEYYLNSLLIILDKIQSRQPISNNIRILYFCEEEDNDTVSHNIDLLKTHFSDSDFVLHFIKVDDTITDWKQMLIMSCCNHNIIANSSFSWWGAYMNSFENKIVCYPSKWFGEKMHLNYGHKSTRDLFPKNWIRVST